MVATFRFLGEFALVLSGALVATMAHAGGGTSSSYAGMRDNSFASAAASSSNTTLQFNNQTAIGTGTNPNNSFPFNPEQQVSPNSGSNRNYVLAVTSVEWQNKTKWITYDLDPETMNLIMNLNYTFTIHPVIKGPNGASALPDGNYLVRIAVVLPDSAAERFTQFAGLDRNPLKVERLASWTQVVATSSNGVVTAKNVKLPFPNATAKSITNDLLLELSPMEDSENGKILLSSVRPTILSGPFFANKEGHIIGDAGQEILKPRPKRANTLSQFIAEAESYKAYRKSQIPRFNSTREAAQAYARQNNLKFVTMNSAEIQRILRDEWVQKKNGAGTLAQFLTTPDGESAKMYGNPVLPAMFCSLLSDKLIRGGMNYIPINCLLKYSQYLRVSKNVHVASIGEMSQKNFRPRQMKFNLSGNYMVSRSHSNDVFSGVSINPFVFGIRLVEAVGLASPINYNFAVNESNSRSQAENMILSGSTPIDVNKVTAFIPLKRFLTCVTVRVAPVINKLKFDNSGYYICNTDEEKSVMIPEEYAHVYERINDSNSIDAQSAEAQGANLMLRGDRDLLAFFYSVRMHQTADHDMKYGTNDALDSAIGYLQSTLSATPGVIGIPVEMKKLTYGAPTTWQKYFGSYQENFLVDARE